MEYDPDDLRIGYEPMPRWLIVAACVTAPIWIPIGRATIVYEECAQWWATRIAWRFQRKP